MEIQEQIEDKIIDWIAFDSGGRLIAFKKDGNLAVQKKGEYNGGELIFCIKQNSQEPQASNDFYTLFVDFDQIRQKVNEEILWAKPAGKIAKTSRRELIDFLVEKLILQNKPKPKIGFGKKVY